MSVIVVTHNSAATVGATLAALGGQLGEGDEVIVFDNASSDPTLEVVAGAAPDARVARSETNLGFAAGADAAAEGASGELLVFLNPDAVPAEGFAQAIRRPLREGRGWSAWMGLVTAKGGTVVNTSGGVVHFTGIAWAGQAGLPVEQAAAAPAEVAFASGACLAVPRHAWEAAGGFAPCFFMYCEDVELCLRLRLAGGRVGMEPTARVDHDYEFAKGADKWRLLERNRWATVIRTYPAPLLVLLAPALMATEAALAVVAVAQGWGGAKARAAGQTLLALPRLLRERRAVQGTRTVGSREFAAFLTPELSSAYLGRIGRSRLLRTLLRAYWRLVLALLR